jgi:hypothetical protein
MLNAFGNTGHATTVVLQDPATGLHNPPLRGCRDDYAPYFGRYKPPDTIMHTGFDSISATPAIWFTTR